MIVEDMSIEGVKLLRPKKFGDARGFFSETFKASVLHANGMPTDFAQDNHSFSATKGVLRGLHFQAPPYEQGKLVRVISGAVFDVAVDIRIGSPTFGKYVSTRLDADNWAQLWVPPGFAHGFLTLEQDTIVLYKTTNEYAPSAEGGLAWDDPALKIEWPLAPSVLSDRDTKWPRLEAFASPFKLDAQ